MATAAEKPRLYLLLAALAFCAALAAHLPFLSGSLLWDDETFLAGNSFISDCSNLGPALNPANLVKMLPVPMSARPVVNVSLIADACSGMGPRGMKATNALLHAFNSALVFFLLLALCGSAPGALFGALVFALHPAAAETVHIITFRSHLLGFFFFTAGLLSSVFFARKPSLPTGAAAAAACLLGVLSVETALVLPAAAALAIAFDSGRPGLKRALPLLAAAVLIGGFYLWFRVPRAGYALPGTAPGIQAPSLLYPAALFQAGYSPPATRTFLQPWRRVYTDPAANLYTMAAVTAEYLRSLPFPSGLSADYAPRVLVSAREGAAPLILCLAALGAGVLLLIRKELTGLGAMLVFAGLLPALNIWPLASIRADRYLYLPLAGFALLAAALLRGALAAGARKREILAAAGVLWLAGLGAQTVRRGPEFKDNVSLFSAAVSRQPASTRARVNLAGALLREGTCGGGLEQLKAAAAADPGCTESKLRLSYALLLCGRGAEASAIIRELPQDPDALYLSALLVLRSDSGRARDLLKAALAAAPARRDFYLALLLAQKKNPAELERGDAEDLARFRNALRSAGLGF